MRVLKPLWIELYRTVIRSPECFPANRFQVLVLEKIPKALLLVISKIVNTPLGHELFLFFLYLFFLCQAESFTAIRNCFRNS